MCVEYSTVSNTKIINNLTFIEHVSIIMLVKYYHNIYYIKQKHTVKHVTQNTVTFKASKHIPNMRLFNIKLKFILGQAVSDSLLWL